MIKNIQADEFYKYVEEGYKVIDVRTREEFEAGHVAEAQYIDVNAADFERQIADLDKATKYIVYCYAGSRSLIACAKMQQNGIDVVNLACGYSGLASVV